MKNTLVIIVVIVLTLINNYLGHFHPPFSIDWTPVLIGTSTLLIFYFTDFKLIYKYLFLIGLIIFNDILIKYFAGGTHDWEGLGWITLFLFLGLFIALIILIIYGLTRENISKKRHFIYLFFSGVLIFGYTSAFDSIGMTWTNNSSDTIKLSKENGVFISKAILSDRIIIYQSDTFEITNCWLEKQTVTNHQGIFKKKLVTGNNYCILNIKGNLKQWAYENEVYFKLNDNESIGYQSIDSIISIILPKNLNTYTLNFYDKGFKKIKEIEIKSGH